MTQRASESLVAVLIRVGLLLALAVLLMAENAQATQLTTSPVSRQTRSAFPTLRQLPDFAAGTRANSKT
jgi:hypothetical protein